jgi:hypothetical protein
VPNDTIGHRGTRNSANRLWNGATSSSLSGSITLLSVRFHDTIDPRPTTTSGMEGPAGETEAVHRYPCLCMPGAFPMPTARSLSQTACLLHLVYIAIILGMGRRTWATPDQLEYLKSWLPLLPRAKKTTGLRTVYLQAYEGFLMKWQPDPIVPVPGTSPEQLAAQAKERLLTVRTEPPHFPTNTHSPPAHHQLV